MNAVAQEEINRYVAAVRVALADLTPRERDELLEDLPEHLAEVVAEADGSLEARLGTPEDYAAELRASAGLSTASAGAGGGSRMAARAGDALTAAAGHARRLDAKLGPLLGYSRVSEFLRLLRPAWWVLRGYLAAMVVTLLLDDDSQQLGVLPRLGGSLLAALVILAVFVIGSIWLGRRAAGFGRWPRRLVHGSGLLLVLFALVGLIEVDEDTRYADETYAIGYSADPTSHIQDVYAYDPEGRLLADVRLYDQDGQPIELGSGSCGWGARDGVVGAGSGSGRPWYREGEYGAPYPRCPGYAPFPTAPPYLAGDGSGPSTDQSPSATADPSAAPSPEPTATPSVGASAGPPVGPTATPSVVPQPAGTPPAPAGTPPRPGAGR